MKMMKTIWTKWKLGWIVLLKTTGFMILLSVLLGPIKIVDIAIGAHDQAVIDNAGFHPKSGIVLVIALLWAPFAFWLTSELTGWLGPSKDKTKEAEQASGR
jgi:hypothetical protein